MSTDMQPDINIGPSAVIAGWVEASIEASIAVIIVTARTYTQAKVVGRMGAEDYLMILSLVRILLTFTSLPNSSSTDHCHAQHISHNPRRVLGHWKTHLLPNTRRDSQRYKI
jgi:hypothetical protein